MPSTLSNPKRWKLKESRSWWRPMVRPRCVRMVPRLSVETVGRPVAPMVTPVPEAAAAMGNWLSWVARVAEMELSVVALLAVERDAVAISQARLVFLAGLYPGH